MHFKPSIAIAAFIAFNIQSAFVYAQTTGATGGPGWSEALPYYNRGNRYMSQGRFEDALHDYQEAVAKCDTDSDFFVNLGTAYEKCSDYLNAQKSFEKAISLNKDDWSASNNLANSLTKQDKLAEAVKAFEDALKKKPPAADAEAIKKDIGDIKKIMEAKGMSTASGSKTSESATSSRQIPVARPTKPKVQVSQSAKMLERKPEDKPTSAIVHTSSPEPVSKSKDWGY